jgi:hypothetical protein
LKVSHKELHSPTGCWEFLPGKSYLILQPEDDGFYKRLTQSSD